MKKSCVIGWPISHSRSPLIHGFWLRQYGIEGSYERLPVEPDKLPDFISRIRSGELLGCNVTLPHKEQVARLVDIVDERVARVGSANTLYMRSGKLHATSTDGEGFCSNVEAQLKDFSWAKTNVVILGAGGSARAITDEILRRGASHITIANRNKARAEQLSHLFGEKVSAMALTGVENAEATCDLLVNTTSLGMQGQPALDMDFPSLPTRAVVADIVYTPLKTQFLARAEARGHRTITGLGMLLHQAVKGFELWFGLRPQVTKELHDLVARDIDPDYHP